MGIAAGLILPPASAHAATEVDARRLAAAPGFISMPSWSTDSLIADVVVFDPAAVAGLATYDKPHQRALGR